jgi:two-component system, response regulator YesN
MYRILVVDDEPIVCQGISSYLYRSNLNISHVETALNGFEALDDLRMEAYDLVLTDIQMGGMNGIELMEAIYTEQKGIPVVVISAHEDFHYAQQAMRLGADDYLIKPVELELLVQVVGRVLRQSQEKRKHQLERSVERKYSVTQLLSTRTIMLNEWLDEGKWPEQELAVLLHDLQIDMPGPHYGVITVHLDVSRGGFHQEEDLSIKDQKLLMYASLNVAQESLEEWAVVSFYSFGSQIVNLVSFPADAVNGVPETTLLSLLARKVQMNIRQALNIASKVGVSGVTDTLSQVPALYKESLRTMDDPGGSDEVLEREHASVQKAAEYIRHHYANKGLKLQDIAQATHLSPAYLSFLFKKVMDQNLWDYLTRLRMEEAKRLLLHSDKKRYEIADLIGYESPEHFSRVFKKYYGVSPADFRK